MHPPPETLILSLSKDPIQCFMGESRFDRLSMSVQGK